MDHMKKGLYFTCHKTGHHSVKCPEKPKKMGDARRNPKKGKSTVRQLLDDEEV